MTRVLSHDARFTLGESIARRKGDANSGLYQLSSGGLTDVSQTMVPEVHGDRNASEARNFVDGVDGGANN